MPQRPREALRAGRGLQPPMPGQVVDERLFPDGDELLGNGSVVHYERTAALRKRMLRLRRGLASGVSNK